MMWNPWHGCHRISEGCLHCYVYRRDGSIGKDASKVFQTSAFDLPLQKDRAGAFRLRGGQEVFTCGTSDFWLEEADAWRPEAYRMMRARQDVRFFIITKRIDRFFSALPDDWGEGYENVAIGCTVENQKRANERLPIFLSAPIKHRLIILAPLLEPISLEGFLDPKAVACVSCGGESGPRARICDYDWVLDARRQCIAHRVPFRFHQTGRHLRKDGRLYTIPRREEGRQARRAGIDYQPF